METQKLAVLLRVIECGSITRASEELPYTQSGISHMIRALERELGFPVLVRSKTGVTPTEEGARLLPALRELVRWSGTLDEIAADINGVTTGRVRIGAYTSLSVNWLPRVLRAFGAQYPDVTLEVTDIGGQSLAEALEEARLDVGLGCRPPEGRTGWIPLFDDQLMVLAPADRPLGARFPLRQLDGAPFIALPEHYDREVHALFQTHGIVPDVRFSATDDYTIVSLVEQGLGISILPELVLRGYRHCRIRTAPLDPPCHRQLGIVLPSLNEASPATRRFVACAKRMARRAAAGDDPL